MKKYMPVFFIFSLFFSCKKQNSGASAPVSNGFSVETEFTLNGKLWSTSASAISAMYITPSGSIHTDSINCTFDSAYAITFHNLQPKIGSYSDEMILGGIVFKAGKHPINDLYSTRKNCADLDSVGGYFQTTQANDVVGNSYRPAKNRLNYITIYSFDAGSKEVKGYLDLAFREPFFPATVFPATFTDTIFLKGNFKISKL